MTKIPMAPRLNGKDFKYNVLLFVWSPFFKWRQPFKLCWPMKYKLKALNMLSAFSLYFIGQHSLNGWRHLKNGLQTNSKTLYLKSLPFNLGAIGILVISYWLNENYFDLKNNFEMATIFFVFLSCISFPHIIWMHKFYKKTDCWTFFILI